MGSSSTRRGPVLGCGGTLGSADPGRARGLSRIERLLRRVMSRKLDAEVAALESLRTSRATLATLLDAR